MLTIKKWPDKTQWRRFFKVLTKKEKNAFLGFLGLFIFSFIFLSVNFYLKNTEIAPARGGTHIEGVIGQPRFINPVYANSDTDRDLVQLIFSGLMKYDNDLQIVSDLAESYEINQDRTEYKFRLKENLFWQDGELITADDVVFTVKTIQNPDFKSPYRASWMGVEVEKINNLTIKFNLKKPYASFLENTTLKIIPKHIWEKISPENFPFDDHNLKPIGSGSYKLKGINQDKSVRSLILTRNSLYAGEKPNISEIKFIFFDNEEELIKAASRRKIKRFSLSSLINVDRSFEANLLSLPRYFAVFFNQEKSKVLAEKEVRLALNYGTDKSKISEKIVHSPILPEIYGFEAPVEIYQYDLEKARDILEKAGFKDENQDGWREKIIKKELAFTFKEDLKQGSRGKEVEELQKCLAKFPEIYPEAEITSFFGQKTKEAVIRLQEKYAKDILEPWGFTKGTGIISKTTRNKLNEICFEESEETLPLKFSLITIDQTQLVEVAELLKQQWVSLGVQIEIEKLPLFQLEQDFIKPRDYEALLFGKVLGAILDPLPFWHSSQKREPGLNLSLYENKKADELLEEIRKTSEPEVRTEKLILFQDILIQDVPAVFLYNPDYIYFTSKEIKGIKANKITDPSKRFVGIEDWYIKTRRAWK